MKFCKSNNHSPVKEFLNALPPKDAQKVAWVLKLAEESGWIPAQYFFQEDEDVDLWEIRITVEIKNYWMLAFRHQDEWIVCNADFSTKTHKAFQKEKDEVREQARNYKAPFHLLSGNHLDKYIKKRKRENEVFKEGFDEGYLLFKVGAILRQTRQTAGLTQAEIAEKLDMSSSLISRIENHAEDLDIDTLQNYVKNWTKKLKTVLTP
ncbi:MAG: helix-turn-helix transcriptional regulator [Balneolaceae bacterium]